MVLIIKNLYMTVFFFTVLFVEISEMVILFWCVCVFVSPGQQWLTEACQFG